VALDRDPGLLVSFEAPHRGGAVDPGDETHRAPRVSPRRHLGLECRAVFSAVSVLARFSGINPRRFRGATVIKLAVSTSVETGNNRFCGHRCWTRDGSSHRHRPPASTDPPPGPGSDWRPMVGAIGNRSWEGQQARRGWNESIQFGTHHRKSAKAFRTEALSPSPVARALSARRPVAPDLPSSSFDAQRGGCISPPRSMRPERARFFDLAGPVTTAGPGDACVFGFALRWS